MPARTLPWLAGLLVLGAGVRAVYLVTPDLDSDMAIVGLMGRHILQGEFPVFFWGQAFAGTAESHLAALLFLLFGASRLTLALAPFLFSLAFLVLTYRLAREAYDREAALLALLLAALPAPFLVTHSVTARANYVENLVLGSLLLLLALRLPRTPEAGWPRACFLLGFVAGVAWYQSPQSVHYLVTAALFLVLHAPRALVSRAALGLPPAFLLGSLPFWVYNLQAPVATFAAIAGQASPGGIVDSSVRYLAHKVPRILGVTGRVSGPELSPFLGLLALHALAVLSLLRRWRAPGSQLILLFLLVTSTIIVVAYNEGSSIRYLLPLYSVIPVMTAAFLVRLRRATPPIFAVALAGLLLVHVAGAVATAEVFDPRKLERYRRERARDRELIELLAADRLTRVYVLDFWDAYRLTFDAGERFVFAEPGRSFYPPYTALVDAAARYGYVVRGHGGRFERQLAAVGGSYRKREVAGYAVFDALVPPPAPPLQPLPRDGWHATASQAPDDAGRALDREPATSWQSSPAAGGGERYELDLGAVRRVGQVAFLFGPTSPPGVRIEVSVDKMRWEPALAAPWSWLFWTDSRLTADRGGRATFRFAPRPARWLRIAPFGQTEPAAWSLGEVFVAEASEAAGASRPGAEALRGGQARAAQGDWPGAIRAFQEAVERDPDWEAPYFRLLAAYERLGLERLGEPYERALALDARGLPAVAAWEYARAARRYPHSHHSYPLLRLLAQYEAERDRARAEEVRRRLAAFTPAREVAASFGGRLRLLGYTVDREEVQPAGHVRVSYFWECLAEVKTDYTVFVHLRGSGAVLGDDHQPLGGRYPTSRWRKGEVVRDDRVIPIPASTEPGPVAITVGVRDATRRKRLHVDGGAATTVRLELTRFRVAPGQS